MLYISANKTRPGETVVYAVDDKDNVLVSAVIRVDYDLSRLRQAYKQQMPGISVSSVEGKLVLSGEASSAGQAEKARALAVAIVGSDKIDQIINQVSVNTPNQVNLRVRIAEVQRSVLKQLGINWTKLGSHFAFATANPTSGAAPDIVGTAVTNAAAVAAGRLVGMKNAADLVGVLDALATEGLVTNLAEPNLTAMNGQTASFLVGGQFPVPSNVSQRRRRGQRSDHRHRLQGFRCETRFRADHHRCQSPQPETSTRSQRARPLAQSPRMASASRR